MIFKTLLNTNPKKYMYNNCYSTYSNIPPNRPNGPNNNLIIICSILLGTYMCIKKR